MHNLVSVDSSGFVIVFSLTQCVRVRVRVSACVCVCAHLCVSACLCVCMSVHVWAFLERASHSYLT